MEQWPRETGQGTVVLVLGVLSLIMCQLLGPFAWILGNQALEKIDRGVAAESERGMVNAGRILGIIATIILAGSLCMVFAYMAVIGTFIFAR
jgi:hypothetical protein